MARNHKFFFDAERRPHARGPAAEQMLMAFLETDVQDSDHVCGVLMDDLVAIGEGEDDAREFVGDAHRVLMSAAGVVIEPLAAPGGTGGPGGPGGTSYRTGIKHFREVLEDWEAFILDDGVADVDRLDDDFA